MSLRNLMTPVEKKVNQEDNDFDRHGYKNTVKKFQNHEKFASIKTQFW